MYTKYKQTQTHYRKSSAVSQVRLVSLKQMVQVKGVDVLEDVKYFSENIISFPFLGSFYVHLPFVSHSFLLSYPFKNFLS